MPEILTQIGPLFYPLLGLSLLGAALIVERFIFFMCLPKLKNAESFRALEKELNDNAGLAKAIRDELLSFRLADLKAKLEHGIHLLRILSVLSPMLGLLGTVLGMIEAFRDIAGQTGPVVPSMIADGLWSAMLTTAYGLTIALPCLFAAFIYARMAEKRLGQFQKHLNTQSLKLEGVKLND
jgi:biopolymer transport protein ExbB